jgi:hydrophobe/amphiphile efflux-1 (HAE1) family protein
MKIAHFFIERPIFASVIWIITLILGGLSYFALPIEQYPQVVPPTIVVTASYPGANADTVAKTVATPLEQEINGVENMLYMSSQSTNDGSMSLTITFELGTDLDTAQVLVQNRVAVAEPRLPEEVRRRGITTRKNSPDLMLVVNLYSPDGTYDQTFIANYATLQLRDRLARIEGVGDIRIFGASEYSMRIWLDPDRIASLGMTAGDVLFALSSKNVQVASGTLGQQPVEKQNAFELNVQTQGRLIEPEQFGEIVVKSTEDGRIVRVKDIGRVELGAESYATRGYLGDKKAVALPIFQRPGTNALATAEAIESTMGELSQRFPPGLEYKIAYNPTVFIAQSIDAVYDTIFEAVILVVLVIILFLQNWRAAIIPIVAIPLSLIGTFAVMAALGFSLNNLTLFGMVLAIGIVVDDAIVVVENMERLMARGMSARDAAHQTMDEVGGALVAIGLVLIAVFLPTTFIEGISGRFFQQFGIVIAVATAFSVAISLTLSPALAALLITHHQQAAPTSAPPFTPNPLPAIFYHFNRFMARFSERYGETVTCTVRRGGRMLVLYGGLMILTVLAFRAVPTGFIPQQDQGYMIVAVQLPPGASLERTDKVIEQAVSRLMKIDGVVNAVGFAGFNGATFTNATNAGAIFPVLADFETRASKGISFDDLMAKMNAEMSQIEDAFVVVIPPPPVRGIGNGGGFKMMLQDRGGLGIDALNGAMWQLAGAANQSGVVTQVFSFYETSTPQLFLDIDRERAERLGVPLDRVYEALTIYLGSAYVNDFNYLGRTYRVNAQADSDYRMTPDDIARLRVRNVEGKMVPLGTLATFADRSGPSRQPRYNLYTAAELQGNTLPGKSSGEALTTMEKLAAQVLPAGIDFEWTELSYQQKNAGSTGGVAFVLAVVFVFLLLAALYESWVLPLAIILIVPMCLLSAMVGVGLAGMDNNILTQIGLVVLIGLASKNAILIVEFAKEREEAGETPMQAAVDAAKLRLRPILMTSFAFILGVVPLVLASGAGAEMRQALGVAVFAGMIGVTLFGLVFTPVFYVLCRLMATRLRARFMKPAHAAPHAG